MKLLKSLNNVSGTLPCVMNTKTTPLIFAVILFLLIRLTNDVPMGHNYFLHSWQFIVIEVTGVTVSSYLCYFLAKKWCMLCMKHRLNIFLEYPVMIAMPTVLTLGVMKLSHDTDLLSELYDLIIPLTIAALTTTGMYLSLKNNYIEKLYATSRLKEQEARNAKTEAELKLLRAQFHPHFLFNMLNTIYFTIDDNNQKARDTVEHLSNLLRSQLYEGEGTVAIEREIAALESYVTLYRLRFGDSTEILSDIDHNYGTDQIYPHMLLPLVENAFKHSGGNPIKIVIVLKRFPNIMELTVRNTISSEPAYASHTSGLGLTNLIKRLELLYNGRYELINEKTEDAYSASLKIEL